MPTSRDRIPAELITSSDKRQIYESRQLSLTTFFLSKIFAKERQRNLGSVLLLISLISGALPANLDIYKHQNSVIKASRTLAALKTKLLFAHSESSIWLGKLQ